MGTLEKRQVSIKIAWNIVSATAFSDLGTVKVEISYSIGLGARKLEKARKTATHNSQFCFRHLLRLYSRGLLHFHPAESRLRHLWFESGHNSEQVMDAPTRLHPVFLPSQSALESPVE